MLIWFLIIFGSLFVAYLAIWPFYFEWRRPQIGPTERHGAEGDFAQLSQGVTHYKWAGPTRGPVAVVIHGEASPMITMEPVVKGLGDLGYRVLAYDLYGRGLSDAPKGLQDRAFFLRQLADLLAYHGLREDLTLAGYSMGGSIATAFAAEQPHCVKQVILLAPSGLIVNDTRFARFCRAVPLMGDWMHAMFAGQHTLKSIPQRSSNKAVDRILRAQRREVDRRGYLPALLSSRRGIMSEVQENEHRQFGRQGIPVIAIWAQEDRMVPLSALGRLAEWNRAARHEVVNKADHGLIYTHGRQLTQALRAALYD